MIALAQGMDWGSKRRRRPTVAVALAALALATGCGSEGAGSEPTTAMQPGPVVNPAPTETATPPSTPEQPSPDDVDGAGEGSPGGDIPLDGTEPPAGSGSTPAAGTGEPVPPAEPPAEPPPPAEPSPGAFVEDSGVDCAIGPLPAFADLQQLTTLPDPFLGLNGERLATRAEWRCRREEIRKLAERFIYGEKPARPASVTGTVSNTSLTVNIQNQGQTASFTATVTMPAGATSPVPAVVVYRTGNFGSSLQDSILAEGVAVIGFDTDSVGTEANKQGAFYTANPDHGDTGTLLAWSWGVSRMIDVIEESGSQIINPRAIGVHGCSRLGKGAFIAGAFDERVALTIPYESGMSGVPAFRFIAPEGGEVLRNAYEYGRWAGETYRQFLVLDATDQNDTVGRARDQQLSGQLQFLLPVDTHEIIGMVAPRGLLVLGNPGIPDLAPRGENVTVQAGAEIYAALGAEQNLSYRSQTNNTTHCSFRQEYVPQLQQSIRKFLKGDPNATTGTLEPDARVAADLAPNIAWQTPTLE
jgi:hypothetical protein